MTAHWSDAQAKAAEARGRELLATEPHATAARYDRAADRIMIELSNGASFAFPPSLIQRLENAAPEQLAEVEIAGAGFGLYWPSLDEDLYVPALLGGIFGTKAWMRELARRAGQRTSPAKAAAARANGAKGGRPRKAA
jgi:hypothetical protein